MLAYYFYQANVKNWLWTVIFPIILTDDRFLSLGFHSVCIGDKRKTDVVNVCISFFILLVSFSAWFPERYTVNRERKPEGIYILGFFFSFRKRSSRRR